MQADRQIKVLLATIAVALLLNGVNPWLRPMPAAAQAQPPADLPMMEVHLRNLDASMDEVENGVDRLVMLMSAMTDGMPGLCVWTVINDGGVANIGLNGRVDLPPNWDFVSREGFRLKAVHGDEFVFEKCQ